MRKLNFGAGLKRLPGFINVDKEDFDFNIFPYPYKDDTFDYIYSHHVLEHLIDPQKVIDELHRISVPNGLIRITVPYWNSKLSANDITHLHRFNDRTFELLCGIGHSYKDVKPKFRLTIEYIPGQQWKYLPFKNKIKDYIPNIIPEITAILRVLK